MADEQTRRQWRERKPRQRESLYAKRRVETDKYWTEALGIDWSSVPDTKDLAGFLFKDLER
jgi:hypothetical protein